MVMEIKIIGDGEPEYAVLGLIHGDEPCGKKAIEKLLSEDRDFKKTVKFILANQKAFQQDKRFLEADLNRSFPGDHESSKYEEQLAAEIMEEIKDLKVFDMHSTRSHKGPFCTLSDLNKQKLDLCKKAGAENIIYFPQEAGTWAEYENGIIVETGIQGTEEAAEGSYKALVNFLAAEGVIEEDYQLSDPDVFVYQGTVEGDWEFLGENFQKIRKGEVYATNGIKELKAEEDFYPVLMSTDGYDGQLGFKAKKINPQQEFQQ